MSLSLFGTLRDGTEIHRAVLSDGPLTVSVISWAAAIQDLRLAGAAGGKPLVLGFETAQPYADCSPFFGAIVGRFANRIANGRFELDGRVYQLSLNEGGHTHLHGGIGGFSERNWSFVDVGPRHAELELISEDGDQGYPGRVTARCRYELDGARLVITLTGRTDAPTVIGLAAHSYFNLEGGGDARGHRLHVPEGAAYTPVDDRLIPTGEIAPTAGTPYDFRQDRAVLSGPAEAYCGYDFNLVLRETATPEPRLVAQVKAPVSGVGLEIWSTEPGLQVYDGGSLNVPEPGLGGARYAIHTGLALEPQRFPDSPNQPGFTNAVLRPGELYRQVTEYRFTAP